MTVTMCLFLAAVIYDANDKEAAAASLLVLCAVSGIIDLIVRYGQ